MGKLKRKLASPSGETLTETLCALLVVALASVALATMLSAANRLNASAVERDDALYAGLTAAEGRTSEPAAGTVTVSGGDFSADFDVNWYGADGLWSYAGDFSAPAEEGGGTP